MSKDNPVFELGLVAPVDVPTVGLFSSGRPFSCRPGFIYSVFKTTSAGPEFVRSLGPNENDRLGKDEELYRVSISGSLKPYKYRETYTFLDGVVVDLDIELFVKVTNGEEVTIAVVQNSQDPLKRLREDTRWFLEKELGQLDYTSVFFPKTKVIKLKTKEYGEQVKQIARGGDYGIEILDVRIRLAMPSELRQRWETDIKNWEDASASEIDAEKLERRRQEVELTKGMTEVDLTIAQTQTEKDIRLEEIQGQKIDTQTQRERTRDEKTREWEYQQQQKAEEIRQEEIRSETEHRIEISTLEQEADRAEHKAAQDFDLSQTRIRQEHQIQTDSIQQEADLLRQAAKFDYALREEAERERHQLELQAIKEEEQRQQQLKALKHQAETQGYLIEIDESRRQQEILDETHQLRIEWLKDQQRLRISSLEDNQKRRLQVEGYKVDLDHQLMLLDYEKKRTEHELSVDRARKENEAQHQASLSLIQLREDLVRSRLALLDRITTGEATLGPELMDRILDVDPMKDQGATPDNIANFVQALNTYLKDGGAEQIRDALNQLSVSDQKALPQPDEDTNQGGV